jgi:hypothetical protein
MKCKYTGREIVSPFDMPTAEDYERFRAWAEESHPSLDLAFCSRNHAEGFYSTTAQQTFGVWWAGYKAGFNVKGETQT